MTTTTKAQQVPQSDLQGAVPVIFAHAPRGCGAVPEVGGVGVIPRTSALLGSRKHGVSALEVQRAGRVGGSVQRCLHV